MFGTPLPPPPGSGEEGPQGGEGRGCALEEAEGDPGACERERKGTNC